MDVTDWLRRIGFGQYQAAFRDNGIGEAVLPHLTVEDLKEIGVATVGDRRMLLAAIAALASPTSSEPPGPQPSPAPPKKGEVSAERRPVTVMFCDLVGSTSLAAKLDAEDWRNLVNAYLDETSAAVTGLGGHVLKKLGDGLMALFGYPKAQENDAERAVRAALAIRRALGYLNARNAARGAPELAARIGIESGLVVVDATGEVFGEAPNVAARVQAAAEPGSVLMTMNVQRHVAGLFVAEEQEARELKGVSAPVRLFRIIRASGGGRRGGVRTLTPFVGREEELALLARRWERARAGEGQLMLIVGEPGLGKSRLIEEFHARLSGTPHTWVEWSASQLLQNTPLHPIGEWGRQRFGVDAPAEQRLADLADTLRLIGLDPAENGPLLAPLVDIPLPPGRSASSPPEELRRRQLAAMTAWVLAGARSQPVVLAFEDLHWADPTSVDLLRALADRGAQAPLLLLATTRLEFRAPWSLRSHHSVISLSPLDRAGVARMVGEISASHGLSEEVIEGVRERTGGVPLFVEEVTRLLLERGEQGGVQAIPPTLQQSLTARLDRLGPAREVAQIGAVLGRDFAYPLLRDVAETDDLRLQASLDRLTEADLLFVEGAPPQANYRFKHALIQDAAYDSLLKSSRQALHRRAAELLRDNPKRATAAPEVIAHHFTQAGLDDLAIEWWGRAGDQALRRSAFQEAIAHLGKAIEMADRAAGVSSRGQNLHVAYRNALIATRGYGAPETRDAFVRAREALSETDAPERLSADYGLWVGSYLRGELPHMRAHAAAFLSDIEANPDAPEASVAHRAAGITHWFAGEYADARTELEQAFALFQPKRDDDLAFRFGHDPGVGAMLYLAICIWPMGEVSRALSLVEQAKTRLASVTHVGTRAYGALHTAMFELMRGDIARVASNAIELTRLANDHELDLWRAFGVLLQGYLRALRGDVAGGLEDMRRGSDLLGQQNAAIFDGLLKMALARTEAAGGDPDRGLATLDNTLQASNQIGHRSFDAELHRARGEIPFKRDPSNPGPAEEAFRTALAIAEEQRARSWGLRAALSLAKLYQSTNRPVEAHAVLAPTLKGFSPTPEMPEIADAQALLAELSESKEVKAAIAQQQRRGQLQVAYGNALIAARGFGALETIEAFARARETAPADAPERLAADFGLWAASYPRAELPSMRRHAADFLADVAARPNSPEAGVAHRAQGITHYFAGEYVEARSHLERALALFEPGRDDDLAFRFGMDPGVPAMAYLAFVLWSFGEIDRALPLVERMKERLSGLAHANTRALGAMHASMFELMRGDRSRARTNALELARIVREYDLRLFRAFGRFLEGWVAADGGALTEGLESMRVGADSLREQNALVFDGLIKIALSDAEARAGDLERAIATLDEALATVHRTGYRAFEAELHRARGDILLKRDAADRASADEALQTAVAIARRQGTRSFGLRAALSLARLYQSTGRPVEAHAVLAPALKGFSPTPEMPEIADAQALLAELSESKEVKAGIAHRERRLRLQTAYGQAVLWSKGFAAEETEAAFARATELAATTDDFSERFAACHLQWSLAMVRGELKSARELASTYLREAEDAGRIMEAGVARRALALMCLFSGDFIEARTHCERALDAYDPVRDREARERFSDDTGIVATSCLAVTNWYLGEVVRARELIDLARRRATELGHAPSMAQPLSMRSYLEHLRGDEAAALTAAEALEVLSREHGMTFWRVMAELHSACARSRLCDPTAGAAGLRRALAAFADQGARHGVAYFQAVLVELEAKTLGADSALARVDETLALQGDNRCDLAYLHRLRGDILLKREPTDPAPAEDAYRTAIAIAKQQGARSYELLASLALGKLYQSTCRPVEAHAILAPALEGFSPTSEMPQIAEARSLLHQLEG